MNTQVDALATLSVVAMGFLTVYVIGRAGSDAQRVPAAAEAEKADKSAVLTAAPAPAQPVGAMLQTVLQALPFPIRITGPQGEVLFSNSLVEEAGESAASGWSAPVGNASVGIRVHIDAPVTVPQAEKKEEQLTAADILADPRRQLRIPVNLSVEVEVLDDAKLTVTGETINFSGNGLALRVPGPLNVGANVAIRAGEDLLLGEVKYCQDAYPGYRVGIQLQQTLAAPAGETQTRDSADPVGGRGAWR